MWRIWSCVKLTSNTSFWKLDKKSVSMLTWSSKLWKSEFWCKYWQPTTSFDIMAKYDKWMTYPESCSKWSTTLRTISLRIASNSWSNTTGYAAILKVMNMKLKWTKKKLFKERTVSLLLWKAKTGKWRMSRSTRRPHKRTPTRSSKWWTKTGVSTYSRTPLSTVSPCSSISHSSKGLTTN